MDAPRFIHTQVGMCNGGPGPDDGHPSLPAGVFHREEALRIVYTSLPDSHYRNLLKRSR